MPRTAPPPLTRRHALALTAAGLALLPGCAGSQTGPAGTRWHRFQWSDPDMRPGGFSGLHLAANGLDLLAVADHGALVRGRFQRDADGRIVAAQVLSRHRLRDAQGRPLGRRASDSEGIAVGSDGTIYISFEGGRHTRVSAYAHPDAPERVLPDAPLFRELPRAGTLESLAIDGQDRLYTMPQSAHQGRFRLLRLDGGQWHEIGALEPVGGHVPVGLDFGPDGHLYLLERHFRIRAFSSRISRLRQGQWSRRELLVETDPGLLGNHEGISVTRAPSGRLRATLIADNNLLPTVPTEIAETLLD